MAKSQTFLQLAPEMGGVRFGPFPGLVQVGSDPRRNQLVLDPAHGIYSVHATIGETAPGMYTVAPAEVGCQVFLVPQGQGQVWPVQSPVQARAGDMLIFGTPAGPRFQLQSTAVVKAPSAAPAGAASGGFLSGLFSPPKNTADTTYGGRVANEMARVSRAKMMTKSPWREIYAVQTRLQTGALSNPRVIVSALTAIATLVVGGGVTCSGLALAVWNAVMR